MLRETFPTGVPVWETQAEVMSRSGQQIAPAGKYVVSRTSLLYAALMLEELGEVLEAQSLLLSSASMREELDAEAEHLAARVDVVLHTGLAGVGFALRSYSKKFRDQISVLPEFCFDVSGAQELVVEWAKEVADLQVVAAGFAVAAGLPAEALYAETQESNLSKINPATGRIDKDPSGKWVKGPGYAPPDLYGVLYAPDEAQIKLSGD